MTNLFQAGEFVLSSGSRSSFKIDCDALTDADWHTLAMLIADRVPAFAAVQGVPLGGQPLAHHLERRAQPWAKSPLLIVDDVLTTGRAMETAKLKALKRNALQPIIGAVVFARGPVPSWIVPLFQMSL